MPSFEWGLKDEASGKVFPIIGEVTVGRDPGSVICISEGHVSRQHARLFIKDRTLMVEDFSTNGTAINGKRIERVAGEASRFSLKHDDILRFDRHLFRVVHQADAGQKSKPPLSENIQSSSTRADQSGPPVEPGQEILPKPAALEKVQKSPEEPKRPPEEKKERKEGDGDPKIEPRQTMWYERHSRGPGGTVFIDQLLIDLPEINMSDKLLGGIIEPTLIGLSGVVKGQQIKLLAGSMVVGRSSQSDARIDHNQVHEKHAQMIVEGGSVSVVSLPNCRNGTYVNGARTNGRVYLGAGDIVTFGNVHFIFWMPEAGRSNDRRKRSYLVSALLAAIVVIVGLALIFAWRR